MSKQPYGFQPQREDSGVLARVLWMPAGGAHAIVKTSGIIAFSENVTSVIIKRLADAVRDCAHAHGMSTEVPVNSIMVEVGPGAPPKSSSQENAGVAFQDVKGATVVQSLMITQEAIRFETQIYTRWVAFEDQMQEYLQALLPIVSNVSAVKSVALEYIDVFVARNEGPTDVHLLLDRKSEYLSRKALKKFEPFHIHSGWFENVNADSRSLVNADVTVSDAEGPGGVRRAVTIRTHEAEHVIDHFGARATALTDPAIVGDIFKVLHDRLKKHLAGVLTRDAQAMISLGN